MESIPFLILLALLIFSYIWYASIITRKNQALQALSGIDVHLKQRLNLVPNILKLAQKFMQHEKALMEEITALRTQTEASYNPDDAQGVKAHLAAANALAGKMGQLMVAVENYPDLKSDQTIVQAMQTYSETEAQITAARRFYNAAVASLNNSIQIFPGNMLAKFAGAQAMPFFEAEDAVHAPIDADAFLN